MISLIAVKNKIERKQKLKTKRKKNHHHENACLFDTMCTIIMCLANHKKKNFKLCKPTTGSKKTHTVNDKVYSM